MATRNKPVGFTGTAAPGGVLQKREQNRELQGAKALGDATRIGAYERHATTDPVVSGCVQAAVLPIAQAPWEVQAPDGVPDNVTDFCRWVVHEALRPSLANFIRETVRGMITTGFHVVEPVYRIEKEGPWKGKVVPRLLAPRPAWTITHWLFDEGEFAGLRQGVADDQGRWATPELRADEVLVFTHDGAGLDPTGRSMLRPLYLYAETKAYLVKLIGIRNEREAIGIPVVTKPEGGLTDGDESALEKSLADYRAGEISYLILPHGCVHDFGGGTGGASDAIRQDIAALDLQMREAFLQNMRSLGTTETGSRAVGEVQADPYYLAIQAIAAEVVEPINALLRQLVIWNFGEMEKYPYLEPPSIRAKDVQAAITPILDAVQKGGLTRTPDVEARLREELGLEALPEEDENSKEMDPDRALNGIQVQALLAILGQVRDGQIPRESGIQAILASFPLTPEAAEEIMGELGQGFKPAPLPEQKPAGGAPPQGKADPAGTAPKAGTEPGVKDPDAVEEEDEAKLSDHHGCNHGPIQFGAWYAPRMLSGPESRVAFAEMSARFDAAPRDLQALVGGVFRRNRDGLEKWAKKYAGPILLGQMAGWDALARADLPRAVRQDIVDAVQAYADELREFGRDQAERERRLAPGVAAREARKVSKEVREEITEEPAEEGFRAEDGGVQFAMFQRFAALGSMAQIYADRIADELLRLLRLAVTRAAMRTRAGNPPLARHPDSLPGPNGEPAVEPENRAPFPALNHVLDEVQTEVDASSESLAVVKDAAMGVSVEAVNTGREEVFQEHAEEIASVTYSAVMDGGTCAECGSWDGKTAASMQDAEAGGLAPTPNPGCAGSAARCRCIYVVDYV